MTGKTHTQTDNSICRDAPYYVRSVWKSKPKFVHTIHTNFHAKSGLCSLRNERVMLNFVIWWSFCFSKLSKFGQTVHANFHVKSGLCSSRNERVMLNFVIWRPSCFSKFCQNLFRLSIRTSMQNLDSVAQEISELCSILRFGGHFVFQKIFNICLDCPYQLPCKIWTL